MKTKKQVIQVWESLKNKPKNLNRFKTFFENRKQDIKRCLDEDRPIYITAKTQSNKTEAKKELISLIQREGWADFFGVSTTNMRDAGAQLKARLDKSLGKDRIQVFYAGDELPNIPNRGQTVISLSNYRQIEKLFEWISNAVAEDYEMKRKPLRYVFILDEGDEFEPASGDPDSDEKGISRTEKNFWDLFFELRNKGVDVDMVKVSATLASAIYTAGTWAGRQKDFKPYQIFDLPLSVDYHGIERGLQYDPILIEEDKTYFSSNKWTEDAQSIKDSNNLENIVRHLDHKIQNKKYDIPEVVNVVYGVAQDSHRLTANWMSKEFESNYIGYKVGILDRNMNVADLDPDCNVVFVIQNGSTERLPISQKLDHIGNYFDRLDLVAVFGDKMTNKSITIDCGYDKGWANPNSKNFGLYCNGTVVYGPTNRNIEAEIQYIRSSGNRPALKDHYVIATPETCDDLENYYKNQKTNLKNMNLNGGWTYGELIEIMNDLPRSKKIGKGKVNKRILRVANSSFANKGKSTGMKITLDQRVDYVDNKGFRERDKVFEITKKEYDRFNSIRDDSKVIDCLVKKGFLLPDQDMTDGKITVRYGKTENGNHYSYKADENVRQKFKQGDTNAKWVIAIWYDITDQKHKLYGMNHDLDPEVADEVEYDFKVKKFKGIDYPYIANARMKKYSKGSGTYSMIAPQAKILKMPTKVVNPKVLDEDNKVDIEFNKKMKIKGVELPAGIDKIISKVGK